MPMRRISYALFGLTLAFGVVGLGACSKNPEPSPVPVVATPAGTTSVGAKSSTAAFFERPPSVARVGKGGRKGGTGSSCASAVGAPSSADPAIHARTARHLMS